MPGKTLNPKPQILTPKPCITPILYCDLQDPSWSFRPGVSSTAPTTRATVCLFQARRVTGLWGLAFKGLLGLGFKGLWGPGCKDLLT